MLCTMLFITWKRILNKKIIEKIWKTVKNKNILLKWQKITTRGPSEGGSEIFKCVHVIHGWSLLPSITKAGGSFWMNIGKHFKLIFYICLNWDLFFSLKYSLYKRPNPKQMCVILYYRVDQCKSWAYAIWSVDPF